MREGKGSRIGKKEKLGFTAVATTAISQLPTPLAILPNCPELEQGGQALIAASSSFLRSEGKLDVSPVTVILKTLAYIRIT